MVVAGTAMPRVCPGMIPKQPHLSGHKISHFTGYLIEPVWKAASVWQRFQQQRHAATVRLPATTQYEFQFRRRQQKVLNELIVRIGRLEPRVAFTHSAPVHRYFCFIFNFPKWIEPEIYI